MNSRSFRCECPAMLRILRSNDNGWYVAEHRVDHNHVLSATCGEKLHWQSHRHMDKYTKDLVKQLRDNNVNVSKVCSIVSSFFGSVDRVRWDWMGPRRRVLMYIYQSSIHCATAQKTVTVEIWTQLMDWCRHSCVARGKAINATGSEYEIRTNKQQHIR
jgi:hypothetical protein